jgi:nickel transport protein
LVVLLGVLVVALLWAQPAHAHKLYVFAQTEGHTIQGNAYFRGGNPAKGLDVSALDPAGEEIGNTTTDDEGKFALEAQFRCDHRLLVHTSDGHGAEYTIMAAQLPADLPPRAGATEPTATPVADTPPVVVPETRPTADSQPEPADASLGTLSDQIASNRAEIIRLQQSLTEFQQQIRLRDVLGGIGYIVGLAGVAFYFLGVRRKRRDG